MRKSWTKEEIAILENYSSGNFPIIPGRTKDAIKSKIKSLGLTSIKKWTKEEIDLLKNSYSSGKIPDLPGRSLKAVKSKTRKLKLTFLKKWTKEEIELLKKNKTVPNRSKSSILEKKSKENIIWKEFEIEILKDLAGEGSKSAKEIYEMKLLENRSIHSIQKKLCRLGLAKKMQSFVKFPMDVRARFKLFLINNWEGKIPDDLVELWNKENANHQTNKHRVVSYLMKLKIKIPYYEVYKIKTLRRKEKKLKEENKDTPKNLEEKIRMQRAELMRERFSKNKDIWTGMDIPVLEDCSF
jgi:hypothetical protein